MALSGKHRLQPASGCSKELASIGDPAHHVTGFGEILVRLERRIPRSPRILVEVYADHQDR